MSQASSAKMHAPGVSARAMRLALGQAGWAVFECSADGQLVLDDSFFELVGLDGADVHTDLQTWVAQLVHEGDQHRVLEQTRAILGGEAAAAELEYRLRGPEGRWLWVRTTLTGDGDGLVGTVQDASEQRAREKDLSLFVEKAPVPVFLKDEKQRFLFANAALRASLAGLVGDDVAAQVVGRRHRELHAASADHVEARDRTVLEEREAQVFLDSFRGEERDVHVRVNLFPVEGVGEGGTGIGGIALDVTEQVEAEHKADRLNENLPLGMTTYRYEPDADRFVLVAANPAAEALLGLELGERLGESLDEIFPGVNETELPAQYRAVVQSGQALREEQKDFHDELFAGVFDSVTFRSAPNEITSVFSDVTDRVMHANLAQQASHFLDSLVEAMPMMLFVKDARELRFVRFNKAGEQLLGQPRANLIGRNDYDLFPKEQADAFTAKDRAVLEGQQPVVVQQEAIDTPSGTRLLRTIKVPLHDAEGKAEYLLGLSEDITEREALLSERDRALAQYRAVFDHAGVGIVLARPSGHLVVVNEAYATMLGYTPEEMQGRHFKDWTHPGDLARDEEAVRSVVQGELPVAHITKRYRAKGGRSVWAELALSLVREASGETFVIAMARDITAEREAIASGEKYFELYEHSPNFLCSVDPRHGTLLECNRAMFERLGYPNKDHIIGRPVLELYHPDSRDAARKVHQRFSRTGKVRDAELALQDRDGNKVEAILNAQAKRDEQGNIIVSHCVLTDMSQVKRLERHNVDLDEARRLAEEHAFKLLERETQLSAANERYQLATQGASVGIFDWVDIQEDRLHATDRYLALLGYGPGEFETPSFQSFSELIHPQDREFTSASLDRALQGAASYDVEYRLRTKSGEYRWFRGTGVVARDPDGTARRMVGSIQDIHEHKELSLLNADLVQSLQETNSELEAFAYVVSHDLQAPLRHIRSFLQLIAARTKPQADERVADWFAQVEQSTTQMQDMIRDLLDFSRVGRPTAPPVHVDLRELADEVARRTTSLSDDGKPRLEVVIGDLPEVVGYQSQLERLFQNMIENAARYCDPSRPARLEIHCTTEDAFVHVAFQDNGIGIDPRFHNKVFGMFQRLETKKVEGSTGIGLAICRKVAQVHGGDIRLESVPGQGTTFYVTLARATATRPSMLPMERSS